MTPRLLQQSIENRLGFLLICRIKCSCHGNASYWNWKFLEARARFSLPPPEVDCPPSWSMLEGRSSPSSTATDPWPGPPIAILDYRRVSSSSADSDGRLQKEREFHRFHIRLARTTNFGILPRPNPQGWTHENWYGHSPDIPRGIPTGLSPRRPPLAVLESAKVTAAPKKAPSLYSPISS